MNDEFAAYHEQPSGKNRPEGFVLATCILCTNLRDGLARLESVMLDEIEALKKLVK